MADDQSAAASLLAPFLGAPPPAPAWFDAAIAEIAAAWTDPAELRHP